MRSPRAPTARCARAVGWPMWYCRRGDSPCGAGGSGHPCLLQRRHPGTAAGMVVPACGRIGRLASFPLLTEQGPMQPHVDIFFHSQQPYTAVRDEDLPQIPLGGSIFPIAISIPRAPMRSITSIMNSMPVPMRSASTAS